MEFGSSYLMGVNKDKEEKGEEAAGRKGGSYTHQPLYKSSCMSREERPITVGAGGQLPATGSTCAISGAPSVLPQRCDDHSIILAAVVYSGAGFRSTEVRSWRNWKAQMMELLGIRAHRCDIVAWPRYPATV